MQIEGEVIGYLQKPCQSIDLREMIDDLTGFTVIVGRSIKSMQRGMSFLR